MRAHSAQAASRGLRPPRSLQEATGAQAVPNAQSDIVIHKAGPLQACSNAIQGTIPNLASLPYQRVNKCTGTSRRGRTAPQNLDDSSSSTVQNTVKFCHLAILTIGFPAIAWEWGNGRIADV